MVKNLVQKNKISKTIIALITNILCISVASVHAENKGNDSSPYAIELRKVDLFAMGYIGFVGHKSPGQQLYEEILKSKNAEPIFLGIIDASDSSVASKLYSLCGLKNLSSTKYKSAKEKVLNTHEKVSTMTADIMRKEDVTELVERIDKFGCQKY